MESKAGPTFPGKDRNLQVYAFQELMMGNALNDIINQPNDKHFTDIVFNKRAGNP
jgi:cellobiose phosphorylase